MASAFALELKVPRRMRRDELLKTESRPVSVYSRKQNATPLVARPHLSEPVSILHGAKASYVSTEHVHEAHGGETVWEGDVHVYSLEGHAEADTCYAWAEPGEGKDRIFAVLKLGPVKTPADAVRASILNDYRDEM